MYKSSYQNLAIEARGLWLSWNEQIARSPPSELPDGLSQDDKLLHECGSYFVAEGPELTRFYKESLETMEKTAPEIRKLQFIKVSKTEPLISTHDDTHTILGEPK